MKLELDLNYRELTLLINFLDYAESENVELDNVIMKVFEQLNK